MSEDSRDKKKHDPKEQRKPRNARNQACKVEKKAEKVEEPRSAPKVPQKTPVYQDPGPEFYKNLKRETEEILKINEEESSKYKKKEIQSNWSKYEMPVESYEEMEEHDVGADYEKLIQAPLSIGGHFQFKHEKSWDVNTGPTLYDKFFEIDMDNLSLAVATIPFYERNCVDLSLFSETDMLSMNNRATKYKQKYYDNKSYSTSETEAQDKILNILKDSVSKNEAEKDTLEASSNEIIKDETTENVGDTSAIENLDLNFKNLANTNEMPGLEHNYKENKYDYTAIEVKKTKEDNDLLIGDKPKQLLKEKPAKKVVDLPFNLTDAKDTKKINEPIEVLPTYCSETKAKDSTASKNPVIESPEDLEKWLDDFLDG